MKGLLAVLLSLVCVVYVLGQSCPTSNDFVIYNGQTPEFTIEAASGDIFLCNNKSLCAYLDLFNQSGPWSTESGSNGAGVFKTVPGSFYAQGPSQRVQTFDGLNQATVNANGRKFFFYGGESAIRAGETGNKSPSPWAAQNIGYESAAFGFNTLASGQTSTSLGHNSEATAEAATAFGTDYDFAKTNTPTSNQAKIVNTAAFVEARGPLASSPGATAFGASTVASGSVSTAFGIGAEASGAAATAFGVQSMATGEASTASGFMTNAAGAYSHAFGYQNNATGKVSASFGEGTVASGTQSATFGLSTTASSSESAAFGRLSTASAVEAVAFGYNSTSSGASSASFGVSSIASGNISTAHGFQTTASGKSANTFGRYTVASGGESFAFGIDGNNANTSDPTILTPTTSEGGVFFPGSRRASFPVESGPQATGRAATAFGGSTVSAGLFATAFGYGTYAEGDATTAFGTQSQATGYASTAFGLRTWAEGQYSSAFGLQTSAVGARATSLGKESTAQFPDSLATGYGTLASGAESVTMGVSTVAFSLGELAVGTCNNYLNLSESANSNSPTAFLDQAPAFTVGNGYPVGFGCNNQSNAFTVLKSGDVYVSGAIYFNVGTNPYAPQAGCRCISSTGTCASNCVGQTKRSLGEETAVASSSEFESLRSEVAELKKQVAQLDIVVKKLLLKSSSK